MKFVCMSDIHGQISKKMTRDVKSLSGDVFIYAGDMQLNDFDIGGRFLQWMNSLPFTHKVAIFGNHDGNYDSINRLAENYNDIHILTNESIVIDGFKIYGSPYSLRYMSWWFMEDEKGLEKIYAEIPDDTDILITHTPAFGILDKHIDGTLIGSTSLAMRIEHLTKLKLHVFGHVHEQYGKHVYENGLIALNASSLNEEYIYTNPPHEVIL